MKKEEFKKRPYVRPTVEVIKMNVDQQILAGSSPVQPGGGGGGGSISIEPPTEDEEDNELSGAKRFNMWNEWED